MEVTGSSPTPKYFFGMVPDLHVFVVEGEGLAAEYDVFDEWCVLATNQEQAFELVRAHTTYSQFAEPLVIKETSAGMQPGVAYASFHPG